MSSKQGVRVVAFFGASLVLLGGAILFASESWESKASGSWPRVTGVITNAYSEHTCGSSRGSNRWEAKLAYAYQANGRSYTGHRSTNMRLYCDRNRDDVMGWLKKNYPVGKTVDVYYNPGDPGASFLRPGVVSKIDVAMIFACLVLSAVMAAGGLLALRRPAGEQKIVRRSVKLSFRIGRR